MADEIVIASRNSSQASVVRRRSRTQTRRISSRIVAEAARFRISISDWLYPAIFLLQFDKKVLHFEKGEKGLNPFPVYRMPVPIEERLDIGEVGHPPSYIIGDGLYLQANEILWANYPNLQRTLEETLLLRVFQHVQGCLTESMEKIDLTEGSNRRSVLADGIMRAMGYESHFRSPPPGSGLPFCHSRAYSGNTNRATFNEVIRSSPGNYIEPPWHPSTVHLAAAMNGSQKFPSLFDGCDGIFIGWLYEILVIGYLPRIEKAMEHAGKLRLDAPGVNELAVEDGDNGGMAGCAMDGFEPVKKAEYGIEPGVIGPIDDRTGTDLGGKHLLGIGKGFLGLAQPVDGQGFAVGHTDRPSAAIALTIEDARNGDSSISFRVKISGAIWMQPL